MHKVCWILVLAFVVVGCGDKTEDPGCDLFLGSAIVTGEVHDLDGSLVPDAEVEFTMSIEHDCRAGFPAVQSRGSTDSDGHFEVLLQSGNAVGTYCVFGRVAGSDSISSGTVRFTSDCRRSEPIYSMEMLLVLTPSN
jgi:hypothetical protein